MPPDAQAEDGLHYFLSYYRAHMLDNTVPYPGVCEALEPGGKTSGWLGLMKMLGDFSAPILDGLGLSRYFKYVHGGNSFETKKPDPQGLNILLRDLGVGPREAMMVGDSEVDVRTARNAGTWACGVSYGLGMEGLRAHPPDLMLDNLVELPEHLNGLSA